MDKNSKEWNEEVLYLDSTKKVIDKKIEKLNLDIAQSKQTVEELRKYYVDGTQIFGDFDNAEMVSVNQVINDNIELANNNIDKANLLIRNRQKPYFGRVDFITDKNDEIKAYIGLTGVEENNNYYVIDWRAPIAELFYEHKKGKAKYSIPDGQVTGELTLKRQYEINNGELIDAFDVDGELFDEYLQKVLSKINADHLHNIAGTIQKEQNEIIRNLKDDLVIVQGYSGSGKTTVALHRIAYALYRLRDLKSANILLFTLNEAFMSHIEGVLPELGEQNTRSATLAKFIGRLLKITKNFEENQEFLTRFVNSSEQDRLEIQAKLDLSIKDKVKEWCANFVNTRKVENGFKVQSKGFTAEMLNDLYAKLDDEKLFPRLNKIANAICTKLKVTKLLAVKRIIFDKIYESFNVPRNIEDIYKLFCKDFGFKSYTGEKIFVEDAILMCLIKENLSDMIIKMDIRHIVIDEVQEYPLLFIDFLLRTFPRAQFSMFGDRYQRTNPTGIDDLQKIIDLNAIFGTSKLYNLDNTYRSSEEIVEYCSKLIGNPRHNVFRYSNGQKVEEMPLADEIVQIASQILFILEKEIAQNGTIGIITGDEVSAREIYHEIAQVCPHKISLVDSAESMALEQIQILPVSLCKGLEFNSVIVINNGGLFNSILGKNLEYIACTRAINKLYVLKNKR